MLFGGSSEIKCYLGACRGSNVILALVRDQMLLGGSSRIKCYLWDLMLFGCSSRIEYLLRVRQVLNDICGLTQDKNEMLFGGSSGIKC